MDFALIPEVEIDLFLTTNNILCNDKYNKAIELMHQHDVILTMYLKNWLIAYTYQDVVIKINQPLSYYQHLFEDQTLTIHDVDMILNHYSFHLSLLPDEVMFQLLLLTTNTLKSVSKALYHRYHTISNTTFFQNTVCKHALLINGYNDINYDVTNTKRIYNTLQPAAGKVVYCDDTSQTSMTFFDTIVKINTFKHITLFLSKTGQVFSKKHTDSDWQLTDVCLPTQDVRWCKHLGGWIFLSQGQIYFGTFNSYNRYTFDARMKKFKNFCFTRLYGVDNILSIQTEKKHLYMLQTNGHLHRYDGKQIELIHQNIHHMAFSKYHSYAGSDDFKLIPCYDGYIELFNTTILFSQNLSNGNCYNFYRPFIDGDFYDNKFMLIDDQHHLFLVHHYKLVDTSIDNAIKVTIVPQTKLAYYVIVNP